jgi:hypothetical protein
MKFSLVALLSLAAAAYAAETATGTMNHKEMATTSAPGAGKATASPSASPSGSKTSKASASPSASQGGKGAPSASPAKAGAIQTTVPMIFGAAGAAMVAAAGLL